MHDNSDAGNTGRQALQLYGGEVQSKTIVFLTRPKADSRDFARGLGVDNPVIISPVFEVRQFAMTADLSKYAGIVIGSRHALVCLSDKNPDGMCAYAVGQRTADAARKMGLVVKTADGNADALVELMAADMPDGRWLYPHGKHVSGDIADRLNNLGIITESRIVYDQVAMPLSAEAKVAFSGDERMVIPLFSPRSAALLSKQTRDLNVRARLSLVAMSASVAAAWDGADPEDIHLAAHPNAREMMNATLAVIQGSS